MQRGELVVLRTGRKPNVAGRDLIAWSVVALTVPFVLFGASRLSSGFDYWPALAIVRGVAYGANVMFAYPMPVYLPFTPLGVLPDPWPELLAPVVCLALLVTGLWLWGGRRTIALIAVLLSPAGLGVVLNANFNCAVAIFGLGLAIWAKQSSRYPLVGVGMALSLWRPANCLPALIVIAASGWRRPAALQATLGATIVLVPLVSLAFLIDPEWVQVYLQILPVYKGWGGFGPHFLAAVGPIGYAAAQVCIALPGVWLLRRRTAAEATAFSLALSVLLATVAGAYSGSLALPALALAANDDRYRSLPGIAGLIGWILIFALWSINFAGSAVAYWFVIQAYPLLRRRGGLASAQADRPTQAADEILGESRPKGLLESPSRFL